MFFKIAVSKTGTIMKTFCVILLCTALIIYSEQSNKGVIDGIYFCLNVLVPSLFPFMALSSFIAYSGTAEITGKPLGRITRLLFGLEHCFAPVILLSLIGGYPVGARGIASLYSNGSASEEDCRKAALFAVCAGPGFLVNYIGLSLYNSEKIGIILFVSQMLSVIITGIFLKFAYKGKKNNNFYKATRVKRIPLGNAIVQSTLDASRGMLSICSFVILFSAFAGIIYAFIPESNARNCILILTEVCSAVNTLSINSPIEAIAFATGFGGLSVHFQIYSALGKLKISKLLFFCIRIIQGILTAIIAHLGLILFTDKQQVFSTAVVSEAGFYKGSAISGIALLGIAICFIYSLHSIKQSNNQKNN